MQMFNFFSRKNFNQICNEKVNRLSDLNHRNGYKIFTSVKEIKSWTNNYFPDFYQMEYKELFNYDVSIRNAVYAYVGNCHMAVNEYLRGINPMLSNSTKLIVDGINEAMKVNNAPENIVVYRTDDYKGLLYKSNNKKIRVGSILNDPAFLSTTLLKNNRISWAEHQSIYERVLLIIEVPKGTKCISASNISSANGEYELILNSGLDIEVLDILYRKGHNYIVYCRAKL